MTYQVDTLKLYERQRGGRPTYSLHKILEETLEMPKTMSQTQRTMRHELVPTADVIVGQFAMENSMGVVYTEEAVNNAYVDYNIQVIRLEKLIADKRKKDPNYNVTVLRRDRSIP